MRGSRRAIAVVGNGVDENGKGDRQRRIRSEIDPGSVSGDEVRLMLAWCSDLLATFDSNRLDRPDPGGVERDKGACRK